MRKRLEAAKRREYDASLARGGFAKGEVFDDSNFAYWGRNVGEGPGRDPFGPGHDPFGPGRDPFGKNSKQQSRREGFFGGDDHNHGVPREEEGWPNFGEAEDARHVFQHRHAGPRPRQGERHRARGAQDFSLAQAYSLFDSMFNGKDPLEGFAGPGGSRSYDVKTTRVRKADGTVVFEREDRRTGETTVRTLGRRSHDAASRGASGFTGSSSEENRGQRDFAAPFDAPRSSDPLARNKRGSDDRGASRGDASAPSAPTRGCHRKSSFSTDAGMPLPLKEDFPKAFALPPTAAPPCAPAAATPAGGRSSLALAGPTIPRGSWAPAGGGASAAPAVHRGGGFIGWSSR